MRPRRNVFILAVATFSLLSCSSGPPPPQKGTPPFYWQAANETFAAGDYLKTNDHLSQLVKSQNEFTARAYPWLLVLNSGLAKGYMEIADAFENGARQTKGSPTAFRKQTSDFRSRANLLVLQFVEQFEKFESANKDDKIPLAFPFPAGHAMPVMELSKVGAGTMLQEAEFAGAQKRATERAMLMATCRAVGAGEDPNKAREAFKAGEVPRSVFMLAMAQAMFEHSQLYGSKKLDIPDRFKLVLKHAGEALEALPDSKEKAELGRKLKDAAK